MEDKLEFGYITDEELHSKSISDRFKFSDSPTFFANAMRDENAQSVRVVIRSKKMFDYAKKVARTTKDGVGLFSFGEYPMEIGRDVFNSAIDIDTGKEYHSLCHPESFVKERLFGMKKYVVFPTMKWATYVRVKPIEWILDDEQQVLISRYKIVSLPLDLNANDILNNIFLRDIVPSGIKGVLHKITEMNGQEKQENASRHR